MVLAIGEISPLAMFCAAIYTLCIVPNGKFLLFPSLFGMLAIKAMAFHKISPFAPFGATIYILYIVKWEISTISLSV